MKNSYFLEMIESLLKDEEVILYENRLSISSEEKSFVITFLENTFEEEALNHPFSKIQFRPDSALWAAEFVYLAAQLILYRKDQNKDLKNLFPELELDISPETMLSVDMCFRYLPDMITQLKLIDTEDPLLDILEMELTKWHYSGINSNLDIDKLNFDVIFTNKRLQQLYLNRIVDFRNEKLAYHIQIVPLLKENFGIYSKDFWKENKSITTHD